MVVFDTDAIIALSREDPAAIAAYRSCAGGPIISCFTWFELLTGVCRTKDPSKSLRDLYAALGNVRIFHCDDTVATLAAKYVADQSSRGEPIGILDCFIAATCVINDEVLVTRNLKHFESIPGLRITRW